MPSRRSCDPAPVPDDTEIARDTARYPPADITPAEFERFVVDLLQSSAAAVEHVDVRLLDRIDGVDGSYVFDATVRFRFLGLDHLVLVEAKRHKNPIKRALVQELHDKLGSVGAQKAAMIATTTYQRGALDYAKVHRIALVTVTEGRYLFHTRSERGAARPLTRDEAARQFGAPAFVAHAYGPGDRPGSTEILELSRPEAVAEAILGITPGTASPDA
jgi:hypothetical protein